MGRRTNRYPNTLEGFAANVNHITKEMLAAGTGTFGDDRVFTHAVWSIGKFDMSLAEFKTKLLRAHKARLITLARADLVEAMDPYDVKRSLINDGLAEFNFVKYV